jgi:hypothetical protein
VPLHKVAGVGEAIATRGASVLYLSAYSLDFDPIEKFFSQFKSILQRIAARTADALEATAADALRTVMPDECRNYFAACGYERFDRIVLY